MKRWIAWLLVGMMVFTCLPVSAETSDTDPVYIRWSDCDTRDGWLTENSCCTISTSSDCGYSGNSVEVEGSTQMWFFSTSQFGWMDFTNVTHVDFWFYTDNVNIFKSASDCGFQLSYTDAWESGGVGVKSMALRKLNLQVGWNHLSLPLDFSTMTNDCDLTKIQKFRFYSVGHSASNSFTVRIDEMCFANQVGLDNAEQILADQVVALIDKIGTVNHYSGPYIETAKDAYDALPDPAKPLVSNYQKLLDAEAAFSSLSGGGSTVLPDDMMKKPAASVDSPSWPISGCDTASAISVAGANEKRVVAIGEDKFTAFIALKNQKPTQIFAQPSISVSGYDLKDLAVKMQLYVSDVAGIDLDGQLEITSSGTCDNKELHFSLKDMGLQNGWNNVYLEMKDGGSTGGQLNVGNINYMRMYFSAIKDTIVAIDNIRVVERMVSDFNEPFDTDAALGKWQSESAMTLEEEALKVTGQESVEVSTSAYKFYVLRPDRTPFEFDLKASVPENVTGITVEFADHAGKKSTISLDPAALTADEFARFMAVPSEMTAEEGFVSEIIKTVTIRVALAGETTLWLDNVMANQRTGNYWRDWVYDYTTTPGEYSFAVIPDIQELTAIYPQKLNKIMQWMVDNKEKENLQFAIDVGDLTWSGHIGNREQFQTAANAFQILQDADIEYSIAYGNHDYESPRDTKLLNQYFPLSNISTFDSFGGVMKDGKIDNIYNCFEVQGNKYMVLSLEFDPLPSTISWANKVIAAHPDHQVIINTHNYMYMNYGQRSSTGDNLWEKLVNKHKNIMLVLCGHEWLPDDPGSLNYRVDTGIYGNTVHQLMVNSQDIDADRGGVGLLLMMRFRDGGQTIDLNYFSPVNDGLAYKKQNQFTITLSETQEQLDADVAAAKEVMDLINALPDMEDITLNDQEQVAAVQQAYDNLTDEQKPLVTNLDKLEDADGKIKELLVMLDEAEALVVVEQITQLPLLENLTLADEAAVVAAREAYNALTETQKGWVDNLDKLEALECRLEELKNEDDSSVDEPSDQPVITPDQPVVTPDQPIVTPDQPIVTPDNPVVELDYGDLNEDGIVDAVDALMVLRAAVGKTQLTEEQKPLADVDGSGKLDAVDALYVLQKAVGKIDKFPVETVA